MGIGQTAQPATEATAQTAQRVTQPVTQIGEAGGGILFSDPHSYFDAKQSFSALAGNVWEDQKAIWAGPLHVKKSDLRWLVPLAATTGVLIATDRHVMTLIHSDEWNRNRSSLLSNSGLAVFGITTVASFGFGVLTRDEHARETGVLAAEALADTFFAVEGLKLATDRAGPGSGSADRFFHDSSPLSSSFPSDHSALAWTAATIFAREYPGPLVQWSAYGLASLVSLSRVTADKHFPSDVLIGAATGYLIGRFVYSRHHDDRMSDRTGATPVAASPVFAFSPEKRALDSKHPSSVRGSPYVPLDSWVYPALKRLAALGYISGQVSDMTPWTRDECLLQTEDAADTAGRQEARSRPLAEQNEALKAIASLKAELAGGDALRLESVYTRETAIGGTPLRDSYHFGQTVANDYGRPYDKGFSNTTGFSTYATSGRYFAYFRGEYENAPGRTADTPGLQQFISGVDGTPLQAPQPVAATSRFEPLEMYAGVRFGFENITFGKQNLWWGPGESSSFSFSTNAEPFYMLRFAQAQPLVLPGSLSHLGKIRTEFIFGKLSGHQWPPRPYVNAQKITLDLTDNFEIGFTRSAFFGGVGHPLTLGSVGDSLISTVSKDYGAYGTRSNPGDRHSGFDFRYRIPGVRQYLSVYSDAYADDDPSPLDNPRRSAWAPGLYLSQIPKLRKLDFRFETYSTWLYMRDVGGRFIYWNNQYRDAYTNDGYLLGSWIGRDSRAYVVSTNYWFSAKSKVQLEYRQVKTGSHFLPGGGTQTDASVTAQWSVTPDCIITAGAQYERYDLPILGIPQRDLLGSMHIVYAPQHWRR